MTPDERTETEELVKARPWNKMPDDPNRTTCGADDGATVCIRPNGHDWQIGHQSEGGRIWL
jgi:hypothetical protein